MAFDLTIVALTNTDPAYQRMTRNFLESVERCGLDQRGIQVYEIEHPSGNFGSPNFSLISFEKLRIVREHLERGETVLLSDVDIVFLKDPLPFLRKELETSDLVCQRGARHHSPPDLGDLCLCTGFFAVKPTALTIDLFDVTEHVENPFRHATDQDYINAKILLLEKYKDLPLTLLPEEEFPCGYYWYENHACCAPHLVHYNYLVGGVQKLRKMEEFGHLFGAPA